MEEKLVPGHLSKAHMERLPSEIQREILTISPWRPYDAVSELAFNVLERAAHHDLMDNLDNTAREHPWRKT